MSELEREQRKFEKSMQVWGPDLNQLDGFEPATTEFQGTWDLDLSLLTDDFFGQRFEDLLILVNRVVTRHFTAHHVSPPTLLSPFALPAIPLRSTCFEEYVQKIARPCMAVLEPWDLLIWDGDTRQQLLVGFIMRVLDDQVFSRLLFGAGWAARRMLWDQDVKFIGEDGKGAAVLRETRALTCSGFSRSRLRAATVNMILQQDGKMPKLFLKAVDELSYLILTQLHPVLTYLETGGAKTDLKLLYQDIHTIVHSAGWLAVQSRRSDSIITFDWPTPGDRWDPILDDVGSMALSKSRSRVKDKESDKGVKGVRRTARIMIAVCPDIKRYTPHTKGQVKFRVLRGKVSCYWGQQDDYDDVEEAGKVEGDPHDPDLVEYAKERRAAYALARLAKFQYRSGQPPSRGLSSARTWELILLLFALVMMARLLYWVWVSPPAQWDWKGLMAAIQEAVENARRGRRDNGQVFSYARY